MEREIKDKVVMVTGGADGIGLSVAKKFALEGAKQVIIVDVDEENGRAAVEEINKTEDIAIFIKYDVSQELDELFNTITNKYKVDVLVNNAGVGEKVNPRKLISINLTAGVDLSLKFLKIMSKQNGGDGGTIINMCSVLGYNIAALFPIYTATKHGLTAFSRALGHEENYGTTGVRVIALCPGLTTTKLGARVQEKYTYLKSQSTDVVGDAAVTVYKTADSGTAWAVDSGKPVKKLDLDYKEV